MKNVLIALCCFISTLNAQNQLGLKLGNYNGLSAYQINPALSAFDNNDWEIQLAGIAVRSNIDYNIIKDFFSSSGLISNEENRLNHYYDLLIQKKGVIDMEMHGPSFMIRYKNHRLGFTSRANGHFDYLINNNVAIKDQEAYFEEILRNPISSTSNGMVWSSWALHYAYSIAINNQIHISAGISPKYVAGYKAGFTKLKSQQLLVDHNPNDFEVTIDDADVILAGIDAQDGIGALIEKNGNGFGLDLGWSILIGESPQNYTWKIGMAIMDLGHINFSNNASIQKFNDEHYFYSNFDFGNDSDVTNVVDIIKQEIDKALNMSQVTEKFKVNLPTSMILHGEWGIKNNVFLSGLFINYFNNSNIGIIKENYIALSPRYETDQISLQFPMSTKAFNTFDVGLSTRIGPITIGGDHLISSLISGRSLNEGNYYLTFKINSSVFGINKNVSNCKKK